tara:strand:- start:1567 stop:2010 length:444 start_codon:yes stop_codon:yes gene_type:complete
MRVSVLVVLLTLAMAACSTMPREFTPVLAEPLSLDPGFAGVMEQCTALVDAGVRADFGNQSLGTVAVGTTAAYGTGAVAMASAGSTLLGSAAAASVAVVAMPVIGILAGVGYSRHVRARREGEIQTAMTTCLAESGYRVERWERVTR